jgi:hypothetical protein
MLNTLPYLQACVEDTLRMNQPKPSSVPYEVLKSGLTVDGNDIPAGINIGTPLFVLHHDPSVFPDPRSFKPERWIASSTTGITPDMVSAAKAASIPFLIGPFNCVGKNQAYHALKLALAHILFCNDIRISGSLTGVGGEHEQEKMRRRKDEYQMLDYILAYRDGPLVEVKARFNSGHT